MKLKTPLILETNGSGLWSDRKRKVKVFRIEAGEYTNELCLHFTNKSWDVEEYGLIYTDQKFIKGFRKHLVDSGVPKEIARDIGYTEQGMQGDDYVSLEYGEKTRRYLLSKLGLK